ncbi:hypothetical protein INR49_031231, partial [Caranx melampygus]
VCPSAEDYRGYDGELGLCVCREAPGRAACGGLCRSRPSTELHLQCQAGGGMELVLSYDNKVSGVSGRVLETLFKKWDYQGTLQCNSYPNSPHPVYIRQVSLASRAASQRRFISCFLSPQGKTPRAQLYVRVMPAGGQCYEPGPFFPTIPRHVTRVGINRRRNLLLRPDWLVTGGLLFGAVVILCLCVTVLILFREYGWQEKEPIRARYRTLQLAYHMGDYSSKGSR